MWSVSSLCPRGKCNVIANYFQINTGLCGEPQPQPPAAGLVTFTRGLASLAHNNGTWALLRSAPGAPSTLNTMPKQILGELAKICSIECPEYRVHPISWSVFMAVNRWQIWQDCLIAELTLTRHSSAVPWGFTLSGGRDQGLTLKVTSGRVWWECATELQV